MECCGCLRWRSSEVRWGDVKLIDAVNSGCLAGAHGPGGFVRKAWLEVWSLAAEADLPTKFTMCFVIKRIGKLKMTRIFISSALRLLCYSFLCFASSRGGWGWRGRTAGTGFAHELKLMSSLDSAGFGSCKAHMVISRAACRKGNTRKCSIWPQNSVPMFPGTPEASYREPHNSEPLCSASVGCFNVRSTNVGGNARQWHPGKLRHPISPCITTTHLRNPLSLHLSFHLPLLSRIPQLHKIKQCQQQQASLWPAVSQLAAPSP